jgi:hypothetical protein
MYGYEVTKVEEKTVTSEHGELTAFVGYEQDAYHANPRDNDNIGTMIFWGPGNYSLGDEQLSYTPDFRVECRRCEGLGSLDTYEVVTRSSVFVQETVGVGFDSEEAAEAWAANLKLDDDEGFRVYAEECPDCDGSGEVEGSGEEWALDRFDALAVRFIRVADYGSNGLHLYFTDDPDDAQGLIYIDADGLAMGWGSYDSTIGQYGKTVDPNERPDDFGGKTVDWYEVIRGCGEIMEAELTEYDEWGRGEVYYWAVEDEDGEVVDSCSGYIGDDGIEYALSEAVSHAEYVLEERAKEARNRAEWEARDVETVA